MDDDQDYVDGGGQPVMMEQPTTTAAAQGRASRILDEYESGKYTGGEKELIDEYSRNTAKATEALKAARERLAGREYDQHQTNLAWAAAQLAPTRSGGMAEGFSRGFEALREEAQRKQQFDAARDQGLTQLDTAIPEQDNKVLEAKLALQRLHEQMAGPIVKQALATLGRSTSARPNTAGLHLKTEDTADGKKQDFSVDILSGKKTPIGEPYGGEPEGDPVAAKAIREYRRAPYAGFAIKDPKNRATMDLVESLPGPDAAYDVRQYNASQAAVKSWQGSGPNAQMLQRFNTAVDHLGRSEGWARDLGNGNMRPLNAVKQWWALNMQGKPMPAVFDATKQMVATEVLASINARGGGQEERQEFANNMRKSNSFPALQAVLQAERGLMAGRLSSARLQFKNETFRGDEDFNKMLSPLAMREVSKLEGQGGQGAAGQPMSEAEILGKWHPQGASATSAAP